MKLSIIIVSYNTKNLLEDCLESIDNQTTFFDYEIIVVDNGSTDGSVEMLENLKTVKLLKLDENIGFGRANNTGFDKAQGKWILFLNSDTVLTSPETLQQLLDQAEARKSDIASCKLVNPDGSLQPQGGSLPTLWNVMGWMLWLDQLPIIRGLFSAYQLREPKAFSRSRSVGWVGGTAMMVRGKAFDELSGFDPQIFMYAEDVDLCFRARRSSYSIWYFHQPEIVHLGQGSGQKADSIIGEYQGVKYLFRKHYPSWQYPVLRVLLKIGAFLRVIIFGMIRGDENKRHIYYQAFRMA